MSVDLSGEITAIATAVLAVGAIVTGVFAFLAFCAQGQQIDTLKQQLQEQRNAVTREQADRRRTQAKRVFAGAPHTPGHRVSPYVMNASKLPIFEVQLWSFGSDGLSDPEDVGMIPPGGQANAPTLVFETGNAAMAGTIITFRDTESKR